MNGCIVETAPYDVNFAKGKEVFMGSESVLKTALSEIKSYLWSEYDNLSVKKIENELRNITKTDFSEVTGSSQKYSYDSLQKALATLNEKCETRKIKGVYYTPSDIVRFMLSNSLNFFYGKIDNDCLNNSLHSTLPYEKICYDCTFFDPTCGSGVFLLATLEMKFNLLEKKSFTPGNKEIEKVVATLFGNDINIDSVTLTKLRLFLCVLQRCGVESIEGISRIFDRNFFFHDFVNDSEKCAVRKYDVVIGNPPYVEDSKAQFSHHDKYGNIYANVLSNASRLLKDNGVMSFVIPLSYISTPRMKKIREELLKNLPKQYILNFADRPDCLFVSVHQKLCILLAGKKSNELKLFTSNYQYWYKEERKNLFDSVSIVSNPFFCQEFIPKLGTKLEMKIYEKIIGNKKSVRDLFVPYGAVPVYLNMRATYWIKVFLSEHLSSEYKIFRCEDTERAKLSVLLLNSSLFWWYWVCVSDCWHITNKELIGFKLPPSFDTQRVTELVDALEKRLEVTKVYVGTKQTEYEYKHKFCKREIQEIDDYVNQLYKFSPEESYYLKNFAYRYRIGEGGVSS